MRYILITVIMAVLLTSCQSQPDVLAVFEQNPEDALQLITENPDASLIIPLIDLYEMYPTQTQEALSIITMENFTTITEWKDYCDRLEITPAKGYKEWKFARLRLLSPFMPPQEEVSDSIGIEHVYTKTTAANVPPGLFYPENMSDSKTIMVTIANEIKEYGFGDLVQMHVINDNVSSQPIVITYCEICKTPVVYNATINGEAHTFVPTNLAYQDNSLIADEKTGTLWNSVTGYPVIGYYANQDLELEILGFSISQE